MIQVDDILNINDIVFFSFFFFFWVCGGIIVRVNSIIGVT